MEKELSNRIEKVVSMAERVVKRIGKEVLDEEFEYPFELALGAKAQRAVSAVQENADLDDEVLAYLALGAALTEIHYFALIQTPFEIPNVAIAIMRRLGYEEVRDQCEMYLVGVLSRAKPKYVNGVLAPHNIAYVVYVTPSGKTVAFKRVLEVRA